MKVPKTPTVLALLIAALALVAAGAGLFWQSDVQPFQFQTLRGETVTIAGQGLYRYDTVSSAAQQRAQDAVTLALGIPLLLASTWLATRGSLRGQLLLAGTLGYFLYTYTSMSFLTAFNPLFLVYVALFSLSLFAFVLTLISFDRATLPDRFSDRLPRRGIAGLFFVTAAFLSLAWLGRIGPALLTGLPPAGLESTTTLVIQVLDLGLVVPLAVLAGVLLLRRSAWGYLLASVALLKFLTMSIAVAAMAVNVLLVGEPISPMEVVMFPSIAVVTLGFTVALLRSVDGSERSHEAYEHRSAG